MFVLQQFCIFIYKLNYSSLFLNYANINIVMVYFVVVFSWKTRI